jgi:hypothetical protein
VLRYVGVAETQRADLVRCEACLSLRSVLHTSGLVVLAAIQFDAELVLMAVKIENVRPHGILPAELQAEESAVA